MRKSILLLMFAVFSLTTASATTTVVNTDPVTTSANSPETIARVNVLLARLDEIKEMDKSDLSRSERKELRTEVRSIKSELAATGNGIYLSIGAIIIIILLLILLL